MTIDDQISTLRPQPGDIIVYTTEHSMTVGQVWELKASLKETFPDNPAAVVMQGTVGYRFEAFTEDELHALRNAVFGHLTDKDDAGLEGILGELDSEVARRGEPTEGAP